MSGPILLPLANASFDLQTLLKNAVQQEHNDQCPASPVASDLSDGYSSLSSLPPSPELSAVASPGNDVPPVKFLDPSETVASLSSVRKMKEVKQSNKITPPNRQDRKRAAAKASRQARRSLQNKAPALARPKARIKYLAQAVPITVDTFSAQKFPAASTGYIGASDGSSHPKSLTLQQAISKHNLTPIEWDGRLVAPLPIPFRRMLMPDMQFFSRDH